jgi:hypothetical protein
MLSKNTSLPLFIEELDIFRDDKLRPEDIYNFYYLNFILSDEREKQSLTLDEINSSRFEIDLIKKKYLDVFLPVVQSQLKKYLSRGRLDPSAFQMDDIKTRDYLKLDEFMKKTYRSDMKRRNINWEELTSNLAKLQRTNNLRDMMFHLDRINNTIHNTAESMLTKFSNSSELIQALKDSHNMNPRQLKLNTKGLNFLAEESPNYKKQSDILAGLISSLKTARPKEKEIINKILDMAITNYLNEDKNEAIADAYRLLPSITQASTRLFIKKFLGLVKKDDWKLGPNLANIKPEEKANFHLLSPIEKEKFLREKGLIGSGGREEKNEKKSNIKIIVNGEFTPDHFWKENGYVYVFIYDRFNREFYAIPSAFETHTDLINPEEDSNFFDLISMFSDQTKKNIVDAFNSKRPLNQHFKSFYTLVEKRQGALQDFLEANIRGRDSYSLGIVSGRTLDNKLAVWSPLSSEEMINLIKQFNVQVEPIINTGYTFKNSKGYIDVDDISEEIEEKKEKAYVFDFDNTLVEYPTDYNFDVVNNPTKKKLWTSLQTLDNEITTGDRDISLYILTGRGQNTINSLYTFLKKNKINNIPKKNIFAVRDKNNDKNIPEQKCKNLKKLRSIYNNVIFFDDDSKNINAAKKLKIKTILVKEELDPITWSSVAKTVMSPLGYSANKAFIYDKDYNQELITGSAVVGHGVLLEKLSKKLNKELDEDHMIRGYWIPSSKELIFYPYYDKFSQERAPDDETVEAVISKFNILPSKTLIFGKKSTLTESIGAEGKMNKESKKIIEDFIHYVCNELKIKTQPKIILQNERGKLKTTGVYENFKNEIRVNTKNRALVDILRTIAHELVHHSQFENGRLYKKHPSIGGEIENEANSKAGIFIKKYAKEINSKIYNDEINMIESINWLITHKMGELDVGN